jgi:hypothetical protein
MSILTFQRNLMHLLYPCSPRSVPGQSDVGAGAGAPARACVENSWVPGMILKEFTIHTTGILRNLFIN